MNTYLALTIGPIYKTIQRARKTRELWAASFALSQFMRCLLERLLPYGTALSPDTRQLGKKFHGAGIWNDNCFFHIHNDRAAALKENLAGLINDARREALGLLLMENSDRTPYEPIAGLRAVLERCWHCHAAWVERDGDEGPVLKELAELLRDPEQLTAFAPRHDDLLAEALFRRETVENLYELGYEEADRRRLFTGYGRLKEKQRLPSLLEIATRELRQHPAALYNEIVSKAISDALEERMRRENKRRPGAQPGEDALEDRYEDGLIVQRLKDKLRTLKKPFKKRFKYVAVVQSDGDGVGSQIQRLKTRTEIETFSAELMAFSTEAVGRIAGFGGIPVFAGGDDLLFVAPLQNEEKRTLFDLIDEINDLFAARQFLSSRGATLSFGVSIAYYKYPLGESLAASRELLQHAAKKLRFRNAAPDATPRAKHSLAFRVLTHSGQSFGAALRFGTDSYATWRNLLREKEKLAGENAFTAGLMHKLEPLRRLLEDACANDLSEWFFEQHFNEAKGTVRKPFIDKARRLAKQVYAEYGALLPEDEDSRWSLPETVLEAQWVDRQKKAYAEGDADRRQAIASEIDSLFKINQLYSVLRLIHFLNADDHE